MCVSWRMLRGVVSNMDQGDGVNEDEDDVEVDAIEMQTRAQTPRAPLLNADGIVAIADDDNKPSDGNPAPINEDELSTSKNKSFTYPDRNQPYTAPPSPSPSQTAPSARPQALSDQR